jgi:4-hydroxymandelate oxidase
MDRSGPLNVDEYHREARARMEGTAYDYYAGGAWDEITVGWNAAAFNEIQIYPRVLRDVTKRSTATTLLGDELSFPLLIAPTAFQGLAHPDAEVASAAAAAAAGIIFTASTLSNRSIEEICRAGGPVWFQLYVYQDRGMAKALVDRAAAAGCRAVVLTVDVPGVGMRERDMRNRFHLPEGLALGNFEAGSDGIPDDLAGSGLAAYVQSCFDASLEWKDVEWLASITDLPVIVKGVMHPDDAVLAAEHGATAIFVSNHGGRQLDTGPATLEVLPEIAEAVEGRAELVLDGGVRRGTDMVKALALGAQAVGIGRAALWGLAVGGQEGVVDVLNILRSEFDAAMAMCGATSVDQIGPEVLRAR